MINNLFELVSVHQLRISPDIFLVMTALSTVEGVALMLDPEFDMIAQATPFIKKVKLARLYPERIAEDLIRAGKDLLQFLQQFPKDILEISRLLKQRKLTIKMEHQGLSSILSTHDQISNRISFSCTFTKPFDYN